MHEDGLQKKTANYTPLSPMSFLPRTASIYPDKTAIVYGSLRRSWADVYQRCRQLASALIQHGVGCGDTVSIIAPNIPAMVEVHYAVPMAGAVLNTINTRLDAATFSYILQHAQSKVVLVDRQFSDELETALQELPNRPLIIDIEDSLYPESSTISDYCYEALLAQGDPEYDWQMPTDEWQAISLNYTSGTTGKPKGVVYHHRGAYLNAVSNLLNWNMGQHPVYLWTLPLFHCNGWCFPWSISASAGTHVCLRNVEAEAIYDLLQRENITHFCGAPVVLNMLAHAQTSYQATHTVNAMTAGAAPPAALIEALEGLGFQITHVYGLTETYGPSTICAWQDEWNPLSPESKANLKARQGVAAPMLEGLMVADPDTLRPVEKDGETMGEVFMRGNIVMKGYLNDLAATEKAFSGGWFHSGDLAVWHADNYIEIKDRSKDIIISGGENISSIEVENALFRHPAVMEAAVIARQDDKWGEVPCAFVDLKDGASATEEEIIQYCRQHLPHFKAPKFVVFGQLPKTSTGKVQKFMLRDRLCRK